MTKRILIFSFIAFLFVSCGTRKINEEQAIRTFCQELALNYPEATLQDLYKSCYQDFFGPEHLLRDTAFAHRYLKSELEECQDMNLGALPPYELTGFRHRFMRVNLSEVLEGRMSESELFARSLQAYPESDTLALSWTEEWNRIEEVAISVNPAWEDAELQAALRNAADQNAAAHHSDAFRRAYKPHYRLVPNVH